MYTQTVLVLLLGRNKEEKVGGRGPPLLVFAQYCARCWGGQDGKQRTGWWSSRSFNRVRWAGEKTPPVEEVNGHVVM